MNELITQETALAFRQADLSSFTSLEEAWKQCKIGFNVEEQRLFRETTDKTTGKRIFVRVPEKAICRNDSDMYLGSVGEGFKTLQPIDQLRIFEPLLQSGYFKLDQGFTLQGGKKVIIQVCVKDMIADIVPGDSVQAKLSFVQGLEGSMSAEMLETFIRIVCANTLKMAQIEARKNGKSIKMKHTASLHTKVGNIAELVAKIGHNFSKQVEAYKYMASKALNRADQALYFAKVLQLPEPKPFESYYDNRTIQKLEQLVETGRGNSSRTRGTQWGAFNAVTEYLDHERGRNRDSGLTGSWFGNGKGIRDRAFSEAIEANYTVLQ